MSPHTQEQAAAAQETYREANLSVERIFEELEAGIVPRPDTLRVVVSNFSPAYWIMAHPC